LFHLPFGRIDQAGDGEVIMFDACPKHPAALLLWGVRRGLAFDGVGNFLRERMSGIADGDEEEFEAVAVRFVELPQVDHLLAEDVSGEAAEDEHDGFAAAEVAEADRSPILQARQGEVRSD
jgi:hypothetical protein